MPAADLFGNALLGNDLVITISSFVFVDLRRASRAALSSLKALDWVQESLGTLQDPGDHVIWVVAPWVLEMLPDEATPRLRDLVSACQPRLGHRLAIVAPQGQPQEPIPIAAELSRMGLRPASEALSLRTKSRGEFLVPAITLLEDSYLYAAWTAHRG